ncbi:MAG: hypothetical protein EU531_07675 [Promethearchaeota archaeon]|nr:MAG: hypothetical protein EU531_07675 [Candidatus Lokiarchaeota archaeon]
MRENTKILVEVIGIISLFLIGIFGLAWLTINVLLPESGEEERDSTIIINKNDDWAILAANTSWCYGSGNISDPYIIENITIDIKKDWANCMDIRNSNVLFIIRNCRFLQTSCCYPDNCLCGIRYGIKLENVSNGIFINNTFFFHDKGIRAENCSFMIFSSNYFIQSYYGIILYDCFNNSIMENYFNNKIEGVLRGFGYGVYEVSGCFNNTFSSNQIFFAGLYISKYSIYMNLSNLVYGKPLYIYRDTQNLIPENFTDAGYVILENCTNVSIQNITIQHTYKGIYLDNCINVSISNCSVYWNVGTDILNSKNITIKDTEFSHGGLQFSNSSYSNFFHNNLYSTGIYLSESDENTISFNLLNYTYWGVYLEEGSDYNLIVNNTIFYENTCFLISSDCIGNQCINNTCTQI